MRDLPLCVSKSTNTYTLVKCFKTMYPNTRFMIERTELFT